MSPENSDREHGDGMMSESESFDHITPHQAKLAALRKELNKEMKVKEGMS